MVSLLRAALVDYYRECFRKGDGEKEKRREKKEGAEKCLLDGNREKGTAIPGW